MASADQATETQATAPDSAGYADPSVETRSGAPADQRASDARNGGLSTADIAAGAAGGGATGPQPAPTATATGPQPAPTGAAADRNLDNANTNGSDEAPLFASDQAAGLRSRWQEIQTGFVDEPRTAVRQADGLVAEVMQQLATTFATERKALEGQWAEGQQISTEDLRIALQRYRSFFNRLLSI